jgi:hypothetical protein
MVEQWMHTMVLVNAQPDVKHFPDWKMPLLGAMEQEVKEMLGPILTGQAPAMDLLTAKYTYANKALATYYGLPAAASLPADNTFQKVMLPDDGKRGGVLRQGSFLVGSSHPDSHSPTRRGKWVLDRILCTSPPPPPGNIPAFEAPTMAEGSTLREKLEAVHLKLGTTCASCHSVIDPIGFAFENYDGAGLWRTKDNGKDVDASGALPCTIEKFVGAAGLSAAIAKDDRFPSCVAKQVLTYALGRKMTPTDQTAIDNLGKEFATGGLKMPQLVELVAKSPLMTHRTAEKE